MRLDISRRLEVRFRPPELRLTARRLGVATVSIVLLLAACDAAATPAASGGERTPQPDAFRVVATTTVLADLVAAVGGTNVSVSSLVPKGGEVHTFDPTPSDISTVAEAQLIVMNGLGLDDWLAETIEDAGATAPVLRLAEDLPGVDYLSGDEHEGESVNPHLWLNVEYARAYVERIGEALASTDPGQAVSYFAGSAAYDAVLEELDAWVKEETGTIPEANRNVVSFHEAFPYFAAAYGLTIVDTVVAAPGQDPSAGDVAQLVAEIEANDVKAIFSEIQFNDDLVRTIADETGAVVVSDLYNDSLGDPPVHTYEGMIRWDTERIVEALR
jgi:ABC-type Zn uptake system ZnuABC Zn-binding protein ZnuA